MGVKIAYLMPTYSDIPPKVFATHMVSCILAERKGYRITQVGIQEKQLICHARNTLVEEFLTTDCTHALWFDADITVPPWAVCCMVELEKDMVSGIYFQKVAPPYFPVIYTKKGFSKWKKGQKGLHHIIRAWDEGTYFPIDACGFGCVLIKREVFEGIKPPWFKFTEESSEDIDFCMKVRKKGFGIYADSRVLCGHIGPKGEITYEDYKRCTKDLPPVTTVRYDPETDKCETIHNDIIRV